MKKSQHNSSTSLFLMEMILALLFLSLCSAACIQIFAAARKNRIQAEQWNQIQALTTSVGEALEGSNGSPKQLLALLPDGTQTDNSLIWYFTTIPGRTVPEMRQITKWFSFCPQPPLKNPESFPSAISRKILCFIRSP